MKKKARGMFALVEGDCEWVIFSGRNYKVLSFLSSDVQDLIFAQRNKEYSKGIFNEYQLFPGLLTTSVATAVGKWWLSFLQLLPAQKFCLVLHQIIVSFFIFFACRELLVSLLRKSLDGFIGAHPNHSEKALESTQLYTKSGLSALFCPLLLDHQFILKTHTQPKTTQPEKLTHQQPRMQSHQKLTLPPRCALV